MYSLFVAAALLADSAQAGACCVGSTSTVPTRLGECEKLMAGLSLGAETAVGRWTTDGALASSSLQDDAVLGALAGAWRWDRKGQVGLSLPMRVNHKGTDQLDLWGGGAGDLTATLLWDPLDEYPRGTELKALPVPVLTAGLRAPTGRTWEQADGLLLEDVTGRPGPGLLLGVSIERTVDRTPWSLGVDSELALDDGHIRPVLSFNGSLGHYLGTRWSVTGMARHERGLGVGDDSASNSRTVLAAKVTTARQLAWRAWMGVEGDVPLPLLGHGNQRVLGASLGAALVR